MRTNSVTAVPEHFGGTSHWLTEETPDRIYYELRTFFAGTEINLRWVGVLIGSIVYAHTHTHYYCTMHPNLRGAGVFVCVCLVLGTGPPSPT